MSPKQLGKRTQSVEQQYIPNEIENDAMNNGDASPHSKLTGVGAIGVKRSSDQAMDKGGKG